MASDDAILLVVKLDKLGFVTIRHNVTIWHGYRSMDMPFEGAEN